MDNQKMIRDLEVFAAEIRLETVRMSASLGFDLSGGTLSLADAVATLYGGVMCTDPEDTTRGERDMFVLSSSYCAPVLYAALNIKGYLKPAYYTERVYENGSEKRVMNTAGPGFKVTQDYDINLPFIDFSMNVDRDIKNGLEFTTGSPGHGLSQAAGAALGNRIQGRNNYVYIAIDTSEADSGQTWEAAQFAAHNKLDHLVCLVDNNTLQRANQDDDISNHGKEISAKFSAFGWNVINVADGNNIQQVYDALTAAKEAREQPVCLALNTTAGKGVSVAESSRFYSQPVPVMRYSEAISECEAALTAIR